MTDTLKLVVDGKPLEGWTFAQITAGVSRVPRTFMLGTIWDVDDKLAKALRLAPAGQPALLLYGDQMLLTGYIDSVRSHLTHGYHEILYQGRGMCEDLVDNSFEFTQSGGTSPNAVPVGSIYGCSVGQAITKIAGTYGIDVQISNRNAIHVSTGSPSPQLSATVGDSSYSAIEELNSWAGAMLYEDGHGTLVIGNPGMEAPSKSIINHLRCVQSEVHADLSDVHSDYFIYSQLPGTDQGDKPEPGTNHNTIWDKRKIVGQDTARRRIYRRIIQAVLNPQIYNPKDNYQQYYADWFANRQMGLAQQVVVVVPGWTDDEKRLWTPNSVVNVALPHQNIGSDRAPIQLLIAECQYEISPETGSFTRMTLMPQDAFMATPVVMPWSADQAAVVPPAPPTSTPSPAQPAGTQQPGQ